MRLWGSITDLIIIGRELGSNIDSAPSPATKKWGVLRGLARANDKVVGGDDKGMRSNEGDMGSGVGEVRAGGEGAGNNVDAREVHAHGWPAANLY